MFQTLAALLLVLSTATAFANDHDDHSDFPEGTLLALEGQDAVSKKECKLFVTDLGTENGQLVAKVVTSYSHGQQSPEEITVGVSPARADVLAGVGSNGKDQIAIFLGTADDIQTAQSFNLKWWHVNHFHTYRCINLKVHSHDEDEH